MSVICQCPSCRTKYQLGDRYAGRTVKCPKCSAAVAVPALAQPTNQSAAAPKTSSPGDAEKAATPPVSAKPELPKARDVSRAEDTSAVPAPSASALAKTARAVVRPPADTASDDQDIDSEPPADDVFGFLSAEAAKPKRTLPPTNFDQYGTFAEEAAEPIRGTRPQLRTGSKSRPAPPVAEQSSDEEEPADDDLGFLAEEQARPKRRTGPKPRPAPLVAEQSSDEEEPADDVEDALASISSLAARSSKGTPSFRAKKKKKGFPGWVIPTIASMGVGAVVLIGAIYYLNSNSSTKSGTRAAASAPAGGKGSSKAAPGPKVPVLTLDWPESERAGASLTVNGEKKEVPSTGAIEIPLPPSKDQYHFHLERPGFKPKEFARVFHEDDKQTISDWEKPESIGLDWEQDFDVAKATAASGHKHVLIFFDASDSKESSYPSSRFKEAVAKRNEFRERADKEYVCVYIDNPQGAAARVEVKDADRNETLTKKFRITVFPTVVVTDAKGRPYGVLEGYTINGVTAFLGLMDKWAADAKQFFALLKKFDAMPKESPDRDLAGEVLDFLELSKLDRFYAHTLKKATACLPPGEGRPITKDAADMWMQRLALAARNSDEARKVVDEFDQWKKTRTFKDREMGAKLHLVTAIILARLDLRKEAAQKCKEGLDLHPHDPMVRAYLEQFSRYLSVEPGKPFMMPVSSGTGYCIAQGNYLLTNHHVIHGFKEIKVRLNGETEMNPAKLIADNPTEDMAILKVELPGGRKLAPIPLMANELKIGEDVCAMGWPGVMSHNITLTLTKGVVSTLPATDDSEAFIVTDCTVNPGNSGGPLCSFQGAVAGMVTRKSQITSHQSSYGLAIPVGRLRKFLAEKLPLGAQMPPAEGTNAASMKLSDLAEKITPSVVYIENIQEIKPAGQGKEHEQEQEPGE